MYSEELKKAAQDIIDVHVPPAFKFCEYDGAEDVDGLELYEELFDYAWEIKENMSLFSPFNLFLNHKDRVLAFLRDHQNDKTIGEICRVCLAFCLRIRDLIG